MAVAILSGPERRRRWTQAEKLRLVEETLAAEANIAEIARRHDVCRSESAILILIFRVVGGASEAILVRQVESGNGLRIELEVGS
jgi:transposase